MSIDSIEMRNLKRRVALLEERLSELEDSHGETLTKLRRGQVALRLENKIIFEHLGISRTVTEEDIDEGMDSFL